MATVLVCGDGEIGREVVEKHLRGFHVRRVSGFEVGERARRVSCVIMCLEALDSIGLGAAERLRRRYPMAGFLLVTVLSAETVVALADAPHLAECVLDLSDVGPQLAEGVRASLKRHVLERAAETLTWLRDIPPAVKSFARRVWGRVSPPTNVARAAREIPFGETVLREAWAAAGFSARLKEAVDWALLLRAADAVWAGTSWERAAFALDITKARVGRIAARLLGAELRDIEQRDAEWLAARFGEWLVAALPPEPVK